MKTGIELIAQERQEQIEKHGRTVEKDIQQNGSYQLAICAAKLLNFPASVNAANLPPERWDIDVFRKMYHKPYMERLVLAGALIAAELDRLNSPD